MASLTEVAKEAGVSLTTASLVLNPGKQKSRVSQACAQRVRTAAERLGYVPNYHAQSMKLGRAGVLAVALDIGDTQSVQAHRSELSGTYFGSMIGAMEVFTRSIGYTLTIIGPDAKLRAPERGLMGIRQRRFDGLIIPGVLVHHEMSRFMTEAPIAPIAVVEYAGTTELPVVDWDEMAGVEMAIRHLSDLGHRNLLWLGPEYRDSRAQTSPREQLFMAAVWNAGLRGNSVRYQANFDHYGDHEHYMGALVDAAETALRQYLSEGSREFTGVICFNDAAAIGACSALQAAGIRVPTDVSVVGFDNVEASLCIPRLTTVSHKLLQMGRRAAELTMEMVQSPEACKAMRGRREIISPELVVRKSTGPARI